MKTTKPTISKESELRLKVIDAVCFGPGISGHLEQFERIETLIADQQRQLLDRLLEHKQYHVQLGDDVSATAVVPVQVINDIREGLTDGIQN